MSSDGTIIEGKTRTIKNYQKYEGLSEKTDIHWFLTWWIGRSIGKNPSYFNTIIINFFFLFFRIFFFDHDYVCI